MRVATIDIGTNTVLLLVAERSSDGSLRAVAERAVITRLGEGVDRTKRLSLAAVRRTSACLSDYARAVRELGVARVCVVGTSAMRDASGGGELRDEVREILGVDARVLSGEEEALLTFRGAIGGLALHSNEEVAVFDIGGGSTEVVLGTMEANLPRIGFSASYDVGSVRLTERLVVHDPPTHTECESMVRNARDIFAKVPLLRAVDRPVGVAGTMTTLASVSLGLTTYDGSRVHGHSMPVAELRRVIAWLASLDLEARKRVPGMEPARADVIVAGGSIAMALLDRWGVDQVRISDRGVRWGLAEELLAMP